MAADDHVTPLLVIVVLDTGAIPPPLFSLFLNLVKKAIFFLLIRDCPLADINEFRRRSDFWPDEKRLSSPVQAERVDYPYPPRRIE